MYQDESEDEYSDVLNKLSAPAQVQGGGESTKKRGEQGALNTKQGSPEKNIELKCHKSLK